VLPPIMMLHHDAYLDYLARNEAILAGHARVMAEELAQVYARQRPDEHGRSVAASVLTSLGGHLQHGWSSHGSALLFALAIDIDETADTAYLGLGALYEKRAEINEAVAEFRKAVELRPDAAETRLRLGVNLKRLERFSEAERELRKLIDAGALPWVETIAIEELGDLLGRSGEDPLPLLRRGVEKYPGNSRLRVQLSFWLDRRGLVAEAQGVIEDALLVIEPEPESPRYQYSRWPLARLEAMREELRKAVGQHEAILADSLRGLTGDMVGGRLSERRDRPGERRDT
jgi:tetratricopeptide (TPR) repeat protein